MLLVHAMHAMPLHTHIVPMSSTTQFLYLIIIVTLQLLWRFSHVFSIIGCHVEIPQPLRQSRLFVFSVLDELILSVFSYRLQSPSIYQSSVSIILNPLEDSLRLFIFFGNHTQSSSIPLAEIIICFRCYTEKRKISPSILFNFT
jgi:hypothetical protein